MKKNNRALKLTLLLLIFVAPFIGALFMYQARDGFHFLTKNVGTLIRPSVEITSFASVPEARRWWMVYYTDTSCDEACYHALAHFETIRQSLLKDNQRLGMILITGTAVTAPPEHVVVIEHEGPLPAGLPLENGRGMWLMDPLGNIILSYDPVALDNRMLLDLRHLLKVSQIG